MYIKSLIIGLLGFLTLACTEDFDELSKDPVSLSPNPEGQMTFTQLSLSGDRYYQWRANLIYSGGFIQHYAGSWNVTTFGSFVAKNDDYALSLWAQAYTNELKNINDVINQSEDDPEKSNLNAMAKIVRVMVMHRVTDMYGDVPYSEAASGIATPKYDTQEEIYTSFFADLASAEAQLSTTDGGTVTSDVFYGGDVASWKKLANTLRLRLGMRISEANPTEAAIQVQAALTGGVFDSNADNCITKHDDTAFNTDGSVDDFRGNGLAQAFIGNAGGDRFSAMFINYLQDNADPRLSVIATPRLNDENWGPIDGADPLFAGVVVGNMGWQHPGGASAASGIQPVFASRNTPFLHVSYSEAQLLLAEAAQRGFITGTPSTYYNAGVEAGIKQYEAYGTAAVDQAVIDAYLAANPLAAGTEIEQISSQLWVTYLFNSVEAYANWRRTGFPVLDARSPTLGETGGVVPLRLYYPNEELLRNEASYLDAISRINGGENDWLQPVWWDK